MTAATGAIASLLGLEKLGIKFGLENITAICAAIGRPQDAWRSVIVAGTNGKGSVSAMVETGLRASGLRTGLYTSPHLVDLSERFVIDGRPVARDALEAAAAELLATVERLESSRVLAAAPTFFEVTTAIAFQLFRRARVEVAVLEVGMGGRFDATNVASPDAAAITTIDLDHEQFLGSTIERIAFEKAGVIKPGMPVVVGERKPAAVEVIARVCRERGAAIVRAHDGVAAPLVSGPGGLVLKLRTPERDYGELSPALRGRHQVDNAVVAARTLETLGRTGLTVDRSAVVAALTETIWPGRLDTRRDGRGREVLLDGAHNPAAARFLASYLEESFPWGLPLVFGIMKDKNAPQTLGPLLRSAAPLILTRARTERATEPSSLAAVARRAGCQGEPIVEPDAGAALERAWSFAPRACACGSIFLVGEVLERLGLPAWPPASGGK